MVFFRSCLVISLILFIFSACADDPDLGHGTGRIAVSLIWQTPDGQRPLATPSAHNITDPGIPLVTMRASISAAEFEEDIVGEFPFEDLYGSLDGIPVGADRTLVLEAIDDNNNIVYQGATSGIKIEAGVTTEAGYVEMVLLPEFTPPDPPTVEAVTTPTNINTQTLTGTKPPDTAIWINGSEVVSLDTGSTWSYDVTLTNGQNTFSITAVNEAGYESSAVIVNIVFDELPPDPPTVDPVTTPTNINTQTLTGTKPPDTAIWINGSEAVPQNANSTWSYAVSLTSGFNLFSVTAKNSRGYESSAVIVNIVFDDTPPDPPTVDAVTTPTNVNTQTLTGSKPADTAVWINGSEVVPLDNSATWSYTVSLSSGANNFSVTVKDEVALESSVVGVSIEYDNVAPAAPTVDALPATVGNASLSISGTKEADTSIWINDGFTVTEVVSLDGTTSWSGTHGLTEGSNTLKVTARDGAGNESGFTSVIITLDTTAPAAPVITSPATSPYHTNSTPVTLSGSKAADSSIWISVNGGAVAEAVALDNTTIWTVNMPLTTDNTYDYAVTSRDAMGNESTADTTTVIKDTVLPVVPTLDAVPAATNVSPHTFSGGKEADTSIWVSINAAAETEVVALDATAAWGVAIALPTGTNTLDFTAHDAADNISATFASATIFYSTTGPNDPLINPVTSPTSTATQTLTGTKVTNTSIWISVNTGASAEVVVLDIFATWTVINFALVEGTNLLAVTSKDLAGNTSGATMATIELDTTRPAFRD